MDFLNHPETDRIISQAFIEDIGEGDHTTLATIPEGTRRKARCLVKDEGIIAGIDLAERIFSHLGDDFVFHKKMEDGTSVKYGDIPFTIEGPARLLLTGERLVLNLMQRMSGIATFAHGLVEQLHGLHTQLLDTRKTTPLIRHMEKWAVTIGGATNHRFGLYDMIMIKDNHADYAGGIENAINAVEVYQDENDLDLKVEIETRNLDEVKQVLQIGKIDRIMLDNMDANTMREAVDMINGRYETEASGNITMETIREKAESGVDFLSMGALTHSVKSMDISLKAY